MLVVDLRDLSEILRGPPDMSRFIGRGLHARLLQPFPRVGAPITARFVFQHQCLIQDTNHHRTCANIPRAGVDVAVSQIMSLEVVLSR